jgi:hypothetical protein
MGPHHARLLLSLLASLAVVACQGRPNLAVDQTLSVTLPAEGGIADFVALEAMLYAEPETPAAGLTFEVTYRITPAGAIEDGVVTSELAMEVSSSVAVEGPLWVGLPHEMFHGYYDEISLARICDLDGADCVDGIEFLRQPEPTHFQQVLSDLLPSILHQRAVVDWVEVDAVPVLVVPTWAE